MRRVILGILAVVFVAGGASLYFFDQAEETMPGASGVLLRVGAVLGAFWLAYPQLSSIPWWFVQAALVAALLVAFRPKAALVVLPILAVLWIIRPKKRGPKKVAAKKVASGTRESKGG